MRNGIGACLILVCGALSGACAYGGAESAWPDWDAFSARFVQDDGRVIDLTFDQKSTSEGQSYGLFFALVANRRAQFDTMLTWTSANLADGRLGDRLPAWLWGQRADGSWGVKDQNAAADGDLWIAYTLLEAARLWHEPSYAERGRKLLELIRRREVVLAGAAGSVLLPAPVGFALDHERWRIDPSYLPGFMFRYLALIDPEGPWAAVWDGYLGMAPRIFAAGVAPDLFVVDRAGAVMPDTEREPSGSYDAIRVYLWAGMSGRGSRKLIELLTPYAALVRVNGAPPEKVDPRTAVVTKADYSPTGYSGAMLPFLAAAGDTATLAREYERVRAAGGSGKKTNYYDQALILFGKGWHEGKYRFDEDGRLQPAWAR